jgi:hypothetical protein
MKIARAIMQMVRMTHTAILADAMTSYHDDLEPGQNVIAPANCHNADPEPAQEAVTPAPKAIFSATNVASRTWARVNRGVQNLAERLPSNSRNWKKLTRRST